MAHEFWKYIDPAVQAFHKEKYVRGCHACTRSRYDKKTGWHCLLKHKDYPRLDMDSCDDWRKHDKKR